MTDLLETLDSLNAANLMRHIRFLSADLGPRRPASPAERAAADYVQRELAGIVNVRQEPFEGTPQLAYKVVPPFLIGTLGMLLAFGRNPVRRTLGALLAFSAAFLIPSVWRWRRMPWEGVLPRGQSQNVIAQIPAMGTPQRKVVIVAGLDSAHHKFTADPRLVFLTPFLAPLAVAGLSVGGVLSLINRLRWVRLLVIPAAAFGALHHTVDDLTGSVPGANDNASGAALALALAQKLNEQPLANTEILFAFTGCTESGGEGLHAFLNRHGGELHDALFIEIEAVGAGELCWVTRHGLSPLSSYDSDADLMQTAERAAAACPQLGALGKPMLMVDGVSILADEGLSGITITGYDRLSGCSPHRHRYDDTIQAIQPESVERAARFVWEMLQVIDAQQ